MNFLKVFSRAANLIRFQALPKQQNEMLRLFSTAPAAAPIEETTHQASAAPQNNVELDKLYKRVELEMRGIDKAVLLSYSWFCTAAASHLGIAVINSWAPRKTDKERFTLLKSVHIYKKHKVQYEVRTYFRFIHLQRLTGSTCDTYLEYIERNLPEGCALKVTKVECITLPEHLKETPKIEGK